MKKEENKSEDNRKIIQAMQEFRLLSKRKRKLILGALTIGLVLIAAGLIIGLSLKNRRQNPEVKPEYEVLVSGSETEGSFDYDYWNSPATVPTDKGEPEADTQEEQDFTSGREEDAEETLSAASEPAGTETEMPEGTEGTPEADTTESVHEITQDYTARVTTLDVGQGSCVVIESAGEYVMIDTGDTDHAQVPVAHLRGRGVSALKYIINTHWDNDHCGATIGLYRNFSCGPLICADYEAPTRTYTSIMKMVSENTIDLIHPHPGDEFTVGNCRIIVNGPVRYDYEEENSNSISMIVTDGHTRMYIGGDTTAESEYDIMQTGADLDCDIYFVNHHGSSTSSSDAFVKALSPEIAVIQCGRDNEYGHPTRKVLSVLQKEGCSLYRTDLQGDIDLYLYGEEGYVFSTAPSNDWTPGVFQGKEE